jgi:nitric oxide reductase NorE protein
MTGGPNKGFETAAIANDRDSSQPDRMNPRPHDAVKPLAGDCVGPADVTTKRIPGEAGTWVFILGDMTLFAIFFLTYLYYRGQQPELFNLSQEELVPAYGVVNTLLLLTSSLFVAIGLPALRAGNVQSGRRWYGGAVPCGLAFSGLKFVEYGEKIAIGFTPATDNFFMFYYLLTGLHFFHLLLGVAFLVWIIGTSTPISVQKPQRFALIEGATCYWHMVDLLWIVLFPLVYLVN